MDLVTTIAIITLEPALQVTEMTVKANANIVSEHSQSIAGHVAMFFNFAQDGGIG